MYRHHPAVLQVRNQADYIPKEKVDKINQFITDLFNGKYEGKY